MLAGNTSTATNAAGTRSNSAQATPRRKPLLPRSLQTLSASSTPRPSPLRNVVVSASATRGAVAEAGARPAVKGNNVGSRSEREKPPPQTPPASDPFDGSPEGTSSRTKWKLNDDARERRNRRKSLADRRRSEGAAGVLSSARKVPVPPSLGGSPHLGLPPSGTPQSAPRTPTRRISVVEPTSVQRASSPFRNVLSEQELNERFEGLMKMITNNKVNPQNSWGLDLIDFFSHFSLFREGSSINFQKASCTLDGCAKIYTSRVDSLSCETNRLLHGLSSTDGPDPKKNNSDEDHGDGDSDLDEGEEGEDREKRKKSRTTRRSGNRLAKAESITAAEIGSLEFSVDPLFKKTSADFDEGGAGGLLLNHLHMQRDGKIIFDASDALLDCEDEDDSNIAVGETPPDPVDIKRLKSKYASLLDSIFDREICPTFASFSFDSNAETFSFGSGDFGRTGAEPDRSLLDGDDCNPFAEREDADLDGLLMAASGAGFEDLDAGVDEDDDNDFADGEVGAVLPAGVTSATARMVDSLIAARQNGDIYAYFDLVASKNWAGPEHWNIRKIAKSGKTAEPTKKAKKAAASSQEVMMIDFLAGAHVDADVLFVPGGASINMPRPRKKTGAHREKNLLPDDWRFSSEQLVSMFTRKGFLVNKTATSTEGDDFDDHMEFEAVDDGGDQAVDHSILYGEEYSELSPEDGVSVSGSFAQGMSTIGEEGSEGYKLDYGSQSAAAWPVSKLLRPTERIKFDRQAKRVDVRRLKENIWNCMAVGDSVDHVPCDDHDENAAVDNAALPLQKQDGGIKEGLAAGEEKRFTDVIKSVRAFYPEKRAREISAAFCFMCLLHLANEKGLHLHGDDGLAQLTVRLE